LAKNLGRAGSSLVGVKVNISNFSFLYSTFYIAVNISLSIYAVGDYGWIDVNIDVWVRCHCFEHCCPCIDL